MTTNNKYHGINTSFKRNGKFPIDADSLFSSLEKANEYLNVELTSAIPATIIGIYNEQNSSENGVYEVVKTENGLELFRLSRQENNLTYDDLSNAIAQLNSEVRLLSSNQTQLRDDLVQSNQSLSQLIPINVSQLNNDAGYLTEHQSLSDYVLKNSLPDFSTFALKTDITDYVTQEWIGQQGFVTQLKTINGISLVGTGDIQISSSEAVDLSNYALKNHTHDEYALKQHEHPEYATTNHIHTQYALIDNIRSDYVLKTELPDFDNYALKTDIPSLEGYATQEWVNQQNFINSLKTINGNSLIGTGDIQISSSGSVDLSNYALKDHTHDYSLVYSAIDHTHINNTKFILKKTYPSYISKDQLNQDNVDRYNNIYWSSDTGSHDINLYDDDELIHFLEDGNVLKWTIKSKNTSGQFVKIENANNSPVYLYFKCPKDDKYGELYSSKIIINSDDSYYYFLFGIVLTQSDYIIIEDIRSGVRFVNSIIDVSNSALLKNDMSNYINALDNTTFNLA